MIVGEEGMIAYHYTNATALKFNSVFIFVFKVS